MFVLLFSTDVQFFAVSVCVCCFMLGSHLLFLVLFPVRVLFVVLFAFVFYIAFEIDPQQDLDYFEDHVNPDDAARVENNSEQSEP